MDRALLSALSAILGSLVGGSASILTAWLTQRTQGRRESIMTEVRKREAVYAEFIAEGSKLLVRGLEHDLEDPERLNALYAIQNRIRLFASEEVRVQADQAVTRVIETYFSPDLSPEELRKVLVNRPHDPLKEFSQACRRELLKLQRGI